MPYEKRCYKCNQANTHLNSIFEIGTAVVHHICEPCTFRLIVEDLVEATKEMFT